MYLFFSFKEPTNNIELDVNAHHLTRAHLTLIDSRVILLHVFNHEIVMRTVARVTDAVCTIPHEHERAYRDHVLLVSVFPNYLRNENTDLIFYVQFW